MSEILLEVKNLKKYFSLNSGWFSRKKTLKAVDDVSFSLNRGQTLGIVGESGCGKSTLGRTILRLHSPGSGEIWFEGKNISGSKGRELKNLRRKMQIIFQDPFSSLNPRMTVMQIVREPLDTHRIGTRESRRQAVMELLDLVGLRPQVLSRYPHEFSGGQRQRIGIARALALRPSLIVADEPVSALDVSVQAQVLNLISRLQKKLDLSFIFIAHDLAVVQHVSHVVAVMYLGKIVEKTTAKALYSHPRHPYTRALLAAVPDPDPTQERERFILTGDIPSPINPPAGCSFQSRCPLVHEKCRVKAPELTDRGREGEEHLVRCHLSE